jgi:hypothetical protein
MRTRRLRLPMAGMAAAVVLSGALIGAGAAAAAPTVSVVAKGLNSPRRLTFGPSGDLYVAVAGVGGEDSRRCVPGTGVLGTATRFCPSQNSAVDQVTLTGHSTPVLKILPSVRETDTGQVTGVNAVAFHAGHPAILMGDVQSDATGEAPLNGGQAGSFGVLAEAKPYRKTGQMLLNGGGADISSFAATHPQPAATLGGLPGDTLYDSNPQDLVPYRGGYAVVDAGANDVLTVSSTGATDVLNVDSTLPVSIAARLPTTDETAPANSLGPDSPAQTIAAQAAPSSVTVGPDGALYVGVPRGFPSLPGSAAVYRIVPGQAPVAVTGLTRVTDLAFSPTGQLLILESNTDGELAPVSARGALLSATLHGTTPVTATNLQIPGLVDPVGLAINSSGNAYITNDASGAHQGQIIKVSGLS